MNEQIEYLAARFPEAALERSCSYTKK